MDWQVEALIFVGGLVVLALIGWAMIRSASRRQN
jgi:hypothetical protein